MMEVIVLSILMFLQVVILCVLGYGVRQHIRVKRAVRIFVRRHLNMDCDDLLNQLLVEEKAPTPKDAGRSINEDGINKKRARLTALAAGGQANMSFKGHPLTAERVDSMLDEEIEELYTRYEARLGAAMTKSLGATLIRLYVNAASMVLPLPPERQPALLADLQEDPFVSSALSTSCCELYHRYGMYLAPLTAALTTVKHCDWSGSCSVETIEDPTNNSINTDDGVGTSGTTSAGCLGSN